MYCQFENNEYERADRLMNILERRRDSLLPQFYRALEATDQHDLVQLIKYKGLILVQFSAETDKLVIAVLSYFVF